MLLSIITPYYNTDMHQINRLISSLEKQTCKNYEWIIIDDFSKEVCQKEVKNLLLKTSLNYRYYLNKENVGAGESRNQGIKICQGDYVVFVDSDDYIENDFVEKIDSECKNGDVDMLLFDYYREKNNQIVKKSTFEGKFTQKTTNTELLLGITSNVCGKVIKRSVVVDNGIHFPELKRYEDWVFVCEILARCRTVHYIKETLYHYVNNEGSMVHKYSALTEKYAQIAFDIIKQNKSIEEAALEGLYIREIIYTFVRENIRTCQKKKFIEELKTKSAIYPNWKKCKYVKCFNFHQRITLKLLQMNQYNALKIIFKIV